MTQYKVFFHIGDELGLKTRVQRGAVSLSDSELLLNATTTVSIPITNMKSATLFRLHGLGRVIELDHAEGRLFVSVIRFMIGQLASINFLKTGELHRRLVSAIEAAN